MFWAKAAWLLTDKSPIIKVGFEHGPQGFDDIWVEYDSSFCPSEQSVNPIRKEHIQCKWHTAPNSYSHNDLILPEFIHADSVSLLQKVRKAQVNHASDGKGLRFQLLTNWSVATPLQKYIAQRSRTLHLERLFSTKTDNSEAGAIRKLWREHLNIDESELRLFLQTLSLRESSMSLEELREHLNGMFLGVGLKCIHEGIFPYDEVVFHWMAQNLQEFDRKSFREACRQQGLLQEGQGRAIVYGVKSFIHPIDNLEDRCEKVLDLVHQFDERLIRDQSDWSLTLYPKLKGFLLDFAKEATNLRLALDAHISLAFAAGSVLNIKSGREIELEQRVGGYKIWKAGDSEPTANWATWLYEHELLKAGGDGLVVAVSLTHEISSKVKQFLSASIPNAKALIMARLSSGAGNHSIMSGQHAYNLAETLAQHITTTQADARQPIHLFIAGPDGFTFFLGQRQPSLGKVTLYEYDLEGFHGGTYTASLTLPISTT
jgi:hypothetical protein